MITPNDWYTSRIAETAKELTNIKKRILHISLLRIVFFLAGITAVIALFHAGTGVLIGAVCCTFLPFLALIKLHNRFFARKEWLETQEQINRNELKGLEGDFSGFDEGKEFVNPEHPYSFDLDLFGRNSLFQAINRTCTHIGKQTLARWMQEHLTQKELIELRQQGVRDMSERNEFREEFRITGLVNHGKTSDVEEIRRWSESPSNLLHATWVKLTLWGVPLINIALLAGGLTGICSISWFGLMFMLFVIISFAVIKKATLVQQTYGEKLKTLNSYAKLIALARQQVWKSAEVQQLIERLNIDGHSPAEALMQLSKELDRLDLRNNQLLYVILEGSIFFQLRQVVRIERWKERYGHHLMQWLETVGELDALCSLGTFAYNHPDYSYPSISDKPFQFIATAMGHPLMPAEQCVKNDALIPSRPFFLIITGANMAGKSTYLRTIGVNYLLACIGCPVCCKQLTLYPAQLITSLRTSDSLTDNESYFFAELKRLKRIIDLLNEGHELFIILDEILKGTNSADKQKGSLDLIRQFMHLQTNGIIATHDLLLGTLAEQFPDKIRNYCFEADIKENELSFSYKLREGVAQNMNACFLMRKMGIIIQDE
ncbi:MutS family DNA mismatch repair protein [Phocaeicola sp. HCN-6420]|uniref:MutS family DNA mismatch repair protein n=1 Tax=Phocaeicola sp. HCN-6420 TaxID=3134673 RepID=UPI0030BCB51B